MIAHFLNAQRTSKRIISVTYDCFAVTFSLYLAIALRLGTFSIPAETSILLCLAATLAVSIITFVRLGLYRAVLRYMAHQAMLSVFIGVLVSSITLATTSFYFEAPMPRSVPVIYVFTALFFVGLPRSLFRNLVQLMHPRGKEKVIIYGAGDSGSQLSAALQHSPEFMPVAFIDEDQRLHRSSINGLVVHCVEQLDTLLRQHGVQKILLAVDTNSRHEKHRIVRQLEEYNVTVETIPPVADIVTGRAKIEELRHIEIEDLLGRDAVTPDEQLLGVNITGKVVMVTGAGGSIGSELCRQILHLRPNTLVLLELNEFHLYQVEQQLKQMNICEQVDCEIVPLLGSVQHLRRLETVMRSYHVETVYHAAAYKHVPLIEQNLIEGVRNNVFGTWHCAEAAVAAGVKTFVLISTDKAVRPTNIMGATKRLAELAIQGIAQRQSDTRFCMVRFGNVLGSSGSVVPLFRQQIKEGGPVTVTHPEITRYFMTISEASQLVIQAGALAEGGDVFVLEMGEPVKIVNLAKEMILLSGLSVKDEENPDGEIEIEYTGLRPGEKLYEELLVGGNCTGTIHPRIMRAEEAYLAWEIIEEQLSAMDTMCRQYDFQGLHKLIQSEYTEYRPQHALEDLLHQQKEEEPKLRIVYPAK